MTIAQINKELSDLYIVKPLRINFEMILYSFIGYGFYIYSLTSKSIWPLIISLIFIYRGLSFLHEVSHLYKSHPWTRRIYNSLFGFFNRVPAYSMKSHIYHHSFLTFGKKEDPEYEAWSKKPKLMLLRPFFLSFLYPLFLTLRFGIWPLIVYLLPEKYQLATFRKASTFVMNLKYIRPYEKSDFKDVRSQDIFCSLYLFLFIMIF